PLGRRPSRSRYLRRGGRPLRILRPGDGRSDQGPRPGGGERVNAADTKTLAPRRERTNVYVYYEAHCGQCDWQSADRRQMESDAWNDLQGHLRAEHLGNVREVRIRKTVIEELVEQE